VLKHWRCNCTAFVVVAGACAQTNSDADNIIPDHVMLRGTLRALNHEHMMLLKQRIEEAVPAVVSAFR
jgi:metal-dependent amidase/aminoacylase/carboxypeptidase family protein